MDVDNQYWLDGLTEIDDMQLVADDIRQLVSQVIAELDQPEHSEGMELLHASILMLCQSLSPVMEWVAKQTQDKKREDAHYQHLHREHQEQAIHISALQTRLDAATRKITAMEDENRTLKEQLQAIIGSLDTTLGS